LEDLDDKRQRPSGRLRIYATAIAASEVVAPIWAQFLTAYPHVQLELDLGYGAVDIVTKGFDAGIGPREHAAADMIAVRVPQQASRIRAIWHY
jgi:DNA-binding transcriptional LysR family regulator